MLNKVKAYIYSKFFILFKNILSPLISYEIKFEEESLINDVNIVYVLPERSFMQNIALSLCCEKNKFVSPDEIFRETGNQRNISLRRPKFDNKGHKIKRRLPKNLKTILENNKKETIFLPVSFLWGKSPDKEKSLFKLLFSSSWAVSNPIKNLFKLLLYGRSLIITFHKELNASDLYDEKKDLNQNSLTVNRYIRALFRKSKQASIGPDISHRRTLVKSLVRDKEVRKLVNELSKGEPRQKKKLKKRAIRYANEICSDINYPTVRIFYRSLTWFWNTRYDGINIRGLEKIRTEAKDNSLVFVPCHRSHIDYLALSYILIKEGMMLPQIAAGINLNIPIIGKILRNGGAFYIRRSFGGRRLYSTILSQYIKRLMLRGNSIEFFPEGGRSRTGLSLVPKPGLLSMTLRSFASLKIQKVKVVPIYIGYEKIIEGSSYLSELMGKRKRRENVLDITKVLKDFNNFLGNAYINFGNPIDLGDFLENQGVKDYFLESALEKPEWLLDATDNLGKKVIREINSKAVLTSSSLVATAIVSNKSLTMKKSDLIQRIEFFLSLIKDSNKDIWIPITDVNEILKKTEDLGLIEYNENLKTYSVDKEKYALLNFYKNNTIHLFAIFSLICISLKNSNSQNKTEIFSALNMTYPYLYKRLSLINEQSDLEEVINNSLDYLTKIEIINKNKAYYSPSKLTPKKDMFDSISNLVEEYLES